LLALLLANTEVLKFDNKITAAASITIYPMHYYAAILLGHTTDLSCPSIYKILSKKQSVEKPKLVQMLPSTGLTSVPLFSSKD